LNLSKDFTKDINSQLLSKNYKGLLFCYRDNFRCKLKKRFSQSKEKAFYKIQGGLIRMNIKYVLYSIYLIQLIVV